MKTVRVHDEEVFLAEDRRNKPKECFRFIEKASRSSIVRLSSPQILDVGCATGEFLYYLSKVHKNAQLTGFDISKLMIKRARKTVSRVQFLVADVITGKGLPMKKFDVVYCIGVHSLFDDFKPWLNNLCKLTKQGGKIFIFGFFNPEPIDVLLRIRSASSNKQWQTGWNIFSKQSFGDFLKKKNLRFSFKDWNIDMDVKKNKADPMRSWTFKINKQRIFQNGAQILLHFSLLQIDV